MYEKQQSARILGAWRNHNNFILCCRNYLKKPTSKTDVSITSDCVWLRLFSSKELPNVLFVRGVYIKKLQLAVEKSSFSSLSCLAVNVFLCFNCEIDKHINDKKVNYALI